MRALFEADDVGMSAQVDDEIGGQIDERHRGYVVQEDRKGTEIRNLSIHSKIIPVIFA